MKTVAAEESWTPLPSEGRGKRSVATCWAVLLALVLVAGATVSASPNIAQFAPYGLVPGKSTVLTFSGSGLQHASNVWVSAGGSARRISSTNVDRVSFEVNCPEAARGIQALQLSGPDGASNFRLLMIDSLPGKTQAEGHHSRTNAQRLTLPAAVDCRAESEKVDFYSFVAGAGEKVSIEIIAHRIGSEMDPVVQVLDADGKELGLCDDEPGVWRDTRFVFVRPAAGDYVLALHDAGYGGGSTFPYRLRVTHEPLVWYTYPLIEPGEAGAAFEAVGTDAFEDPVGSPANPLLRAVFSTTAEMAEVEPNDSAEKAQRFSFPVILNGRVDRPNDIDCFRFSVANEDKLVFRSATRAVGSPCDLVLAIKALEGKTLAQSDSNLANDAALTNKFEQGGEYLLELRELSGNATPGVPYRIKVERFQSGLEVSADDNRFDSAPGGAVTIKLKCTRYDFTGPVHFEIWPRIEGLSLEAAELPENQKETELKVRVGEKVAPGFLAHFKIRGTVPSGSQFLVNTTPALHKAFPLMLIAPAALEDLFSVAVKAQ